MSAIRRKINRIYDLLEGYFGDLGWWPAESEFEVVIGAILTQNTSWKNVEKAIEKLKKNDLVDPASIERKSVSNLSKYIRSAGYHRVKADRLKAISRFVLDECGGKLGRLKRRKTSVLRDKLLEVRGVGPETADSILLYALEMPVFVVDAYTKRIFLRHGLINGEARYEDVKTLVEKNFPREHEKLNQFHALLVETAKKFCRKKEAICDGCPLKAVL